MKLKKTEGLNTHDVNMRQNTQDGTQQGTQVNQS